MPFGFEVEGADPREAEHQFLERIATAEASLKDFVAIKPGEKVLLITDSKTHPETLRILKKAIERIGCHYEEFFVNKKTKNEDIEESLKKSEVVINVLGVFTSEVAYDVFDNIIKHGNRMLAIYDASPDIFAKDGALSEDKQELEERLNRMEALLKDAVGFRVTSHYGTDLRVGLRPFKERRWVKDAGIIDKPGQWDNLPGGEIFTTPDEGNVDGVLVLPALDTEVSDRQGVDELIRLTIRDGVITNIAGGKSATKLRKYLEKMAKEQITKEKDNPWNVFRIAEISFGANKKARYFGDAPHVPTIEAEKRFGTMHLAFGDTKHGEEGAEGFEEAVSHLDFVLPRAGLTVEMFKDERDFKKGKNSTRIINDGGVNFY